MRVLKALVLHVLLALVLRVNGVSPYSCMRVLKALVLHVLLALVLRVNG